MTANRRRSTASAASTQSRWDPAGTAAVWLVVLSPAAVLPGGANRFVLVKTVVVGVGIACALWARPRGRLPRWAVAGLVLGACWLAFAALSSPAPWAQIWGRWPRYEGLVTLPAAAGALWVGARTLGPGVDRDRERTVVRATVALAFLVGGVAVAQALGIPVLSSTTDRPGSLLGNATEQGIIGLAAAAVLVPVLVRTATVGRAGGDRLFLRTIAVRATALLLAVLAVVLSGSRGALLGLFAVLVTLGVLLALPAVRTRLGDPGSGSRARKPSSGVGRAALVTVGGATAFTALLALVLPAMSERLLGSNPLAVGTVHGRSLLWSETLQLVRSAPVTGAGPSGFVEAIPAFHTVAWALDVGPANPPDSPHMWLLQAAVGGGLPLLCLALLLAVTSLVVGVRSLRRAVSFGRGGPLLRDGNRDRTMLLVAGLALLCGYAVAAATHFTSPGTTAVVALFGGCVIARGARPDPVPRGALPRATTNLRVCAVALWLLTVSLAAVAEWPLNAAYQAVTIGQVGPGQQADVHFQQAQSLRPWDGDVAVLAAHAFAAAALAGQPEATSTAADWSERALRRVPTSAVALAASAAAAEMSGDLSRAERLMTELVHREPVNAEWLLRRGVIRASSNNRPGAEADFLAAAELAPASPGPWRNLAVLYRLEGDQGAATNAEHEAGSRDSVTQAPD